MKDPVEAEWAHPPNQRARRVGDAAYLGVRQPSFRGCRDFGESIRRGFLLRSE